MRGHREDPGMVALQSYLARLRASGRAYVAGLTLPRVLALGGALVSLSSFLVVLYGIIDAVGDPSALWPVVVVPLLAATALARLVGVRTALVLSGVVLAGGLGLYLSSLPHDPQFLAIIESNIELLTGQSILRIEQADIWALVVAPTPVFVTWYLALRKWYGSAVLVSGGLLFYLVLTGDAGVTVTLLGVVGAGAMVGFGDIDRRGGSFDASEHVAAVLAVMVLTPLLFTVVPGGAATPVSFLGEDGTTMETNVVNSDSSLAVLGSIELSPKVRFTVESEQGAYWRTGSFDRYTGDGWVRSEGQREYDGGRLPPPEGRSVALRQRVTAESDMSVLPAAWRPLQVGEAAANRTIVTQAGGLQLDGRIRAGEQYTVRSAVPSATPDELRETGREYPDRIEERYTQLPGSTPDRVAERTDQITQGADNPYDRAVAIEQWLEANREYSLDIERPEGNIADAFLFEMERGYCTYYATTMVTMLRSQGVPARLATGYTPGEQVGENRRVVRGLNSHAWVEVYFPDVGWVRFDPTPAGPRQEAEQETLTQARANGAEDVDTPETEENQFTPEEEEEPENETVQENTTEENATDTDVPVIPNQRADIESDDGLQLPDVPPRDQIALAAIALVGTVAGLRQSGIVTRVRRSLRLRIQRRSGPRQDIEQAHERLLVFLAREYRPRRTGEPIREYLDAIDAERDARRVAEIREQARYGDEVSADLADEAVRLVDRLQERHTSKTTQNSRFG